MLYRHNAAMVQIETCFFGIIHCRWTDKWVETQIDTLTLIIICAYKQQLNLYFFSKEYIFWTFRALPLRLQHYPGLVIFLLTASLYLIFNFTLLLKQHRIFFRKLWIYAYVYLEGPYMYIRGEFNQECESIHKIRMNKVTEVVNSL